MPGLAHPSDEQAGALAARLAHLQGLRLPAALVRETPHPSTAEVQEHLDQLLHRDAAVFLEVSALLELGAGAWSSRP